MDMIERVAKAIWDSGFDRMPDPAWEQTSHLQKEFHRMLARSAIEAMREMVPMVRENGEIVHELRGSPSAIWATMLNAALTDETNPAARAHA